MTLQVLATAKVHWRLPSQGGRTPPSGSVYAATARFNESNEMFSVVLSFLPAKDKEDSSPTRDEAEVSFLAPKLVEDKLAPGKKLLIAEGSRTVAECEIQSVKLSQFTSVEGYQSTHPSAS